MLAAMLAEWKLGSWAEMMGRAPTPDELIGSLPSAAVVASSRNSEGNRNASGSRARRLVTELAVSPLDRPSREAPPRVGAEPLDLGGLRRLRAGPQARLQLL